MIRNILFSDWMPLCVGGCLALIVALTCLRYGTLERFLNQSLTEWYLYLALTGPVAVFGMVGLVTYVIHSFRLVVDEFIAGNSL